MYDMLDRFIVGNLDKGAKHLMRETQLVRVHLSHQALPLIAVTGIVYVTSLWNDAPSYQLLVWISTIFVLAVIRTLTCMRIERHIDDIDEATLSRYEHWLFWTSLASTSVVGSGYWWVCIEGSTRTVFAVTMLTCIYAIGTTINSSIQYRVFPFLLLTNLGQGIAFFSGLGGKPDVAVAVALVAITMLLLRFGKRNAEIFSESISMRDLNIEQNRKLEQDKKLIEQALKDAHEANQAKSRFLAAASHDLRQPLHALSLFLGTLRQIEKSDGSIELIEKIDETSGVLRDQFNSLLDLSKFDAGGVEIDETKFRLDSLLGLVVDGSRLEAENKGLKISLSAPPVFTRSDELLIERLLRNLVTNAVRYTESGSVSVLCMVIDEDCVISIIDTGPGIESTDQQRIFEDFTQLHNPARKRNEGSGLGLAIVRRIAKLLDLKLKIISTKGHGSKFEFALPYVNSPESQLAPAAEEQSTAETKPQMLSVLIVDDDPYITDAMSRQLSAWGHRATASTTYRGTLEIIEDNHIFDFAFLDDMLGEGSSGLELANLLREKGIANNIYIVTGNVLQERQKQIRDAGFQVFLKPLETNTFLKIISSA